MLQQIADIYVQQVGKALPDYTFVFPNHRAGLFFRRCLAKAITEPTFSPKIISINECFASLTDLRLADEFTLLAMLYDRYRQLRDNPEPIEDFLYWGKMMLSDFSEIDNHLIPHVQELFTAVKDWKLLDTRFDSLSEHQREAIARFWKEYIESQAHHPNNRLHTHFLSTWELLWPLYSHLREGLLAKGLAYDGLLHRQVIEQWNSIPAERMDKHYVFIGFNALTESEKQLMLRLKEADRADFYLDYSGTFLQDPQNRASLFCHDHQQLFPSRFTLPERDHDRPEKIHVIKVPTTLSQTHAVHEVLQSLADNAPQDWNRTAVVLPDEQLLIPMLHAFPQAVKKINVTMGYPLSMFSESDSMHNEEALYIVGQVKERIAQTIAAFPEIEFSEKAQEQMLRMATQNATIPFAGEPLDGLQVMGVLETRVLEFDNLIITGFNDDLYPGRSHQNSFIPYILRKGFGLPTIERQDAIFAYNFYRMFSYAREVWLIANTTADDIHTGEMSRYYYQLQLQYQLPMEEQTRVLATRAMIAQRPAVDKTPEVLERVMNYLQSGISPSGLNQYLRCQKQFYFAHIAGIHPPKPKEDVSASDMTLGTVFHHLAQQLYQPYLGKTVDKTAIEQMQQRLENEWDSWNVLNQVNGDIVAERVVHTYLLNLLEFDATQVPFEHLQSEQTYRFDRVVNEVGKVHFYGIIDRIDRKDNLVRIVDYKTGNKDTLMASVADLFSSTKDNGAILQTLYYCMLYQHAHAGESCAPFLYSLRRMSNPEDYSMQVHTKSGEGITYSAVEQEYLTQLDALLAQIVNAEQPFKPTDENQNKTCAYCEFAALCTQQV